jgi:hypothetical protein
MKHGGIIIQAKSRLDDMQSQNALLHDKIALFLRLWLTQECIDLFSNNTTYLF